jgi:hypothetical protein
MTEYEKKHHFYYASLEKVIDFTEKLCVGLFGFYDASAREITLAAKIIIMLILIKLLINITHQTSNLMQCQDVVIW